MLKKSERLDRSAFSHYFSRGKRIHGSYITVISSPADTFLCSVVVGKKVSKKAHQRNLLRRRLYGLVEVFKKERGLKGSFIIISKPGIAQLSKQAFTAALKEELGRALK